MTFYIKKNPITFRVFAYASVFVLVLACFLFVRNFTGKIRKFKLMVLPLSLWVYKFWDEMEGLFHDLFLLNLLGYHCMSRLIINSLSFDFH